MNGTLAGIGSILSDERGSGSVLALGIVCAVVVVAAGGLALAGAGAAEARTAAAADLAALAAADVAAGRVGGVPCDIADAVARANDATLQECDQTGLTVTVTATTPYLALAASASARAGPSEAPG